MSNIKKLMMSAAGGGGFDVDEVFSTYLYEGTGSAQTITNGIDLSGKGGLVWVKNRDTQDWHHLCDTERGSGKILFSNDANAQVTNNNTISGFSSSGFSLGGDTAVSTNGEDFASWTFRKAPKFFDVVTFTGTGSASTNIPHSLGAAPGMIIIKRTSSSSDWGVWHRGTGVVGGPGVGAGDFTGLSLNATTASAQQAANSYQYFTDTYFKPTYVYDDSNTTMNANGHTYVAYLFAHNDGDGGFGPDGDQDIIKCGSYEGLGTETPAEVTLGWEPQWILVKNITSSSDWAVVDAVRGWPAPTLTMIDPTALNPNRNYAESTTRKFGPTATGFMVRDYHSDINLVNKKYIYMAIRRGPLAPPESATEVFNVTETNSGFTTGITAGFAVDTQLASATSQTSNRWIVDRLRGVRTNASIMTPGLRTNGTDEESPNAGYSLWWDSTGFAIPAEWASINTVFYNWKRAPGFFDVVAYTGTGQASRSITHNLGVSPELVIVKQRSAASNWFAWCSALGNDHHFFPNLNSAKQSSTLYMRSATDTVFNLGTQSSGVAVNSSNVHHVMYLFATLPGISKVGSYTGNGSSTGATQTIDCGFSSGARFVLIKQTSGTGEWFVFDTERGIVSGTDKYLTLQSNASQVSGGDYIDPHSSGFTVVEHPATETNTNGETYIFYAIA